MSGRTITELEQLLAGTDPAGPGPDLELIRRRGRNRRRGRVAAAAGSALALSVVAGVALAALDGAGPDVAQDPQVAATSTSPARTGLTPLARRALEEVPGAVRISPTKVLIPAPGTADFAMRQSVSVHGTPVELPEPAYGGVTLYDPADLPRWLHDGTVAVEQGSVPQGESYEFGTTDITGVVVDAGGRYLACVTVDDDGERADGSSCWPAVVTRAEGDWFLDWGMGTDDFLRPGADMEVFTTDSTVEGADGTLAIAGLDGTDVARAELVATDGTRTAGTVLAGTLVAGDTLIFGEVAGDLARVVAYDASGNVVDDHPLRACTTPVDCEVR